MPSAAKRREHLLASDPHFQSLDRRHAEYEDRLASFRRRRWLSPEDQLEEATMKKQKLAVKDEMERMLR